MVMAEELALMTTESQMNHSSSARKQSTKLLLEDYIHFLHSRQSLHLTMSQLNQIIRIHGFKKIHHAPKKVLIDAVEAVDLVALPRSTLRQNVSAFAILSTEDVINDLTELNWQECCVTSLQKLSSGNNNNNNYSSHNNNNGFFLPDSSSDQHNLQHANHSQSQSESQTQRAPKKMRMIEDVYGGGLVHEDLRSSLRTAKMVPRRKRSSFHSPAVCAASTTVDSASLASC